MATASKRFSKKADGTTELDKCRTSLNPNFVSVSTSNNPADINDYDADGCEDDGTFEEDFDDDNDGVNDVDASDMSLDKCPTGIIGIAVASDPDIDSDGCKNSEDTDDDGDGDLDDVDVDDDNNGLIELTATTPLTNIRHQLDGTSYNDGSTDSDTGCPTADSSAPIPGPAGCNGYELTGDIDLGTAGDWDPVGTNSIPFTAILDGNSFTINNLAISNDDAYTGFLAVLGTNGTVRNLSFAKSATGTGSVTTSNAAGNYMGVLVGRNRGGTISDVSITGISVTVGDGGSNNVGGLVGYNEKGTISNVSTTGTVTVGDGGSNKVGGLVGYNEKGTISNVSTTGTVTVGDGDEDLVGGLVGDNKGTIQNGSATGNVNGGSGDKDHVGGLVGYLNGSSASRAIIQNSSATGSVTSGAGTTNHVGGLVGRSNGDSTIQSSSATGIATGGADEDDRVGGLVGNSGAIIQNSYATGTANGGNGDDDGIGGLVGYNYGTIQNSYSLGTVNGGDGGEPVGGLVGFFSGGTIQNSYALGDVNGGTGDDNVGRLIGKSNTGVVVTTASNYFDGGSTLSVVANEDTELTLSDPKAVGKTSAELKTLTAEITDADFTGDNNGWSTNNWNFGTDSTYPSLKSYEVDLSNAQIAGKLLCGQLPEADFVQCTSNP